MAFIESSSLALQTDLTSDPRARLRSPQPYIAVDGVLTAESDRVALKQAGRVYYRVDECEGETNGEGESGMELGRRDDLSIRTTSTDNTTSSRTHSTSSTNTSVRPTRSERGKEKEKKMGKLRQWFEKCRYQGDLEFYLQPTK